MPFFNKAKLAIICLLKRTNPMIQIKSYWFGLKNTDLYILYRILSNHWILTINALGPKGQRQKGIVYINIILPIGPHLTFSLT
jgi:hypothetical protein